MSLCQLFQLVNKVWREKSIDPTGEIRSIDEIIQNVGMAYLGLPHVVTSITACEGMN